MTLRPLSLAEVARATGRSESWLFEHWREEVRAGRLPAPLHERPIVWDPAQLYAVIDAKLTPQQRAAAFAFRAAFDTAIAGANERMSHDEIAAAQQRLNQKFARA